MYILKYISKMTKIFDPNERKAVIIINQKFYNKNGQIPTINTLSQNILKLLLLTFIVACIYYTILFHYASTIYLKNVLKNLLKQLLFGNFVVGYGKCQAP